MHAYTRVNRQPPAERDIQRYFGVTPPTVHQMILTLERAHLIRRTQGAPRSIEVLVPPQQLPVLQQPDQPVKISVPRKKTCQRNRLANSWIAKSVCMTTTERCINVSP
jgi:DNA-binding GntR family transcriptional regulator